jgi:hypothetical protein
VNNESVFAVDDRHVVSCDFSGGVAKIVCVTLATLTNRNFLLTVCTIHISKIMTQTAWTLDKFSILSFSLGSVSRKPYAARD